MLMQRNTRQRAAIRDVLREIDRPLSPAEILAEAKGQVPGIGIATIYRNVRNLVEEGFLLEVMLPGEPPRYEVAGKAHHHHFCCRQCDRVYDIDACPRDLAGLTPSGFELEAHEIVLYGRCASCSVAATA
jgi:Fur family ferric uptake transcriptional regulator